MNVGSLSASEARERLASDGIAVVVSPWVVRVRSPLRAFADSFAALYSHCEIADATYADVDIRMLPVVGFRHPMRKQVQLLVDGLSPFDTFPRENALPLFEWGLNWVFSQRRNGHLILHSAVVGRADRAILFPAWPGSGKSTLAAYLTFNGWRYFSDEFGIVTLESDEVWPFVRPIALKNESIAVARSFAPNAYLGPVFKGTRKGDVAHLRVPEANALRRDPARIAAVVFPDFQRGEPVSLQRLPRSTAFLKLAGNSFNYEVVGERGFRTVATIMHRNESYILRYGDVEDARAQLEVLLAGSTSQ